MDHLDTYITVDMEYRDELINRWLASELDMSFSYYLKRLVMHYAVGGGSNKAAETLRKTIMVLTDEIENGK